MIVGDKAPDLLGVDQNGKEIHLSDYKGRKVVLYFYPKDMTSGCTAQACNLRDNYDELRKAGYEVVGVSINDQKSHQKFIEKNQLPLRNLAHGVRRACAAASIWARSVRHLLLTKKVS